MNKIVFITDFEIVIVSKVSPACARHLEQAVNRTIRFKDICLTYTLSMLGTEMKKKRTVTKTWG